MPEPTISVHIYAKEKIDIVLRLIDEATIIGSKFIRFNIWWREIEPIEGYINIPILNWYKKVIKYIVRKRLKPITIIGADYPKWFIDKVKEGISVKYMIEKTYDYAYTVSKSMKPYIEVYQLGNELNHPLNPLPNRLKTVFLNTLIRGVTDVVGSSITIVNINANVIGWANFLDRLFATEVGEAIDIIGIDHYPRTWSFADYNDWGLLKYVYDKTKQYNKAIAITETGFATELRFLGNIILRREAKQTTFINTLFKTVLQMFREVPVKFISWYMLWDEDPIACEPMHNVGWCGWGILRTNFARKLGWYALRRWFKWLTS